MLWRFLNSFILIGIILIGVSIAGFATGSKFVTEAGQKPDSLSSLVYLGVGVLMLVNGYVSWKLALQAPEAKSAKAKETPLEEEK